MKRLPKSIGRLVAVPAAAALVAACAGNRETVDDRRTESERQADTTYIPGTSEEGGGGVGGGAPEDPTATDTAGEYGDPNAWPTGPLPSDTGVGGAGSPLPDTLWMDTSRTDESGIPAEPDQGGGGMPGGGTGPDVY